MLEIVDLQTEYRSNPIGLDESRPAFSWKLRSDGRDIRQASCRVRVLKNKELVWDTGLMETDRSVYHVYAGSPTGTANRLSGPGGSIGPAGRNCLRGWLF